MLSSKPNIFFIIVLSIFVCACGGGGSDDNVLAAVPSDQNSAPDNSNNDPNSQNNNTSDNPSENQPENSNDNETSSFKITYVYWVVVNRPDSNGSCSYRFRIRYQGDDPNIQNIKSIRFYVDATGQYWQYSPADEGIYDFANKIIGSIDKGFGNYENGGHTLPVGNMTAKIEFLDGNVSEYKFVTYEPGGPSQEPAISIYTEDYTGEPIDGAKSALLRPTLPENKSFAVDGGFKIYFRVADLNAYNVRVIFLKDRTIIGESDLLIDPNSGEVSQSLNEGSNLNTQDDGLYNNIILFPDASSIHFKDQFGAGDVTGFGIYLLDLDRVESPAQTGISGYSYLSVSEIMPFLDYVPK